MIFYVLIAAFAAGLAAGGFGVNWWNEAALARAEKAQVAAQKKIDDQKKKIEDDAANAVTDMQAAYEAGQAKAKIVYRDKIVQGQAYVAATPVFSNPECVVPADGVQLLNSARLGIRTAANTTGTDAAVSGAGRSTGRQDSNSVPPASQGRGTVGGMPSEQSATSGNSQVPGEGARGHPKPRPIK